MKLRGYFIGGNDHVVECKTSCCMNFVYLIYVRSFQITGQHSQLGFLLMVQHQALSSFQLSSPTLEGIMIHQQDSSSVIILEHTYLPLIYTPIAHMALFTATSEGMAQI